MRHYAHVIAIAGLWTVPGLPTCLNVYRSDVERICDAEHRSGTSVKADARGIMAWMEHDVVSGQGIVFEGQLAGESPRDRAFHLRAEARRQSIAACPLADAFEAFAIDGDYRTAVTSLCDGEAVTEGGAIARLDVAPADDAERMREIRDWTLTTLKGAEALGLVDRVAQTPVQARPALLRAEASRLGIQTCRLANTLEHPPPTPLPESLVALPSFMVTHADGSHIVQEAISGTLTTGSAQQTIDTCYGLELVKAPTLAGNLSLRLTFDAKGKITKAEEASSTLGSPAVVKCIASGLAGEQSLIPADKGAGGAKYIATLAFVPVMGNRTPGWPSSMPIGLSPPLTASPGATPPDGGASPGAGKNKRGVP